MGAEHSSPTVNPSLDSENHSLLQTVMRSSIELPPLMAISRRPHELSSGAPCLTALVRTEKVTRHQGTWRLSIVKQPHWLPHLHRGICVPSETDRWFQNREHTVLIQRQSRRLGSNDKLYATTIKPTHYTIPFPPWESIPVVQLSNANVVLPSEFVQLDQEKYASYRFILHIQPNPPPRTPPLPGPPAPPSLPALPRQPLQPLQPSPQKIPQHVVNGFLEGIIAQGKSCPITMEPLEKESACLTPCGHAMSFDAVEHWIRDAHSCPECRAPLELRYLQRWSS